MSQPQTAMGMVGHHLRESAHSIESISKLVQEDVLRVDTEDGTPFLNPGSYHSLMSAIIELSRHIVELSDEMEELSREQKEAIRQAAQQRATAGGMT